MNPETLSTLVLEDERVKLSPLLPEHYEQLAPVAFQDKTLLQFSPLKVYDQPSLQQFIEHAKSERELGTRYAFVVYDKQKQAFAGSSSYGSLSWYDKKIEIGWTWIGRDFQQTGLNRHMKLLMMQYVFDTMGFERLEFRTDERNKPSRTAMVKIGCRFEGILRGNMLMPDGWRRSTVYYSILKSEWPGVKKNLQAMLR